MRAAFLIEPGRIVVRETALPKPSAGEVLIKVHAGLTCGTDLKAFRRGHALIPTPGPFGHEFSGVIAAVGTGARLFKEGDAIMTVHSAPCRTCSFCKKGLFNLCDTIMTTKVLGAFAEYVLLPAHIVQENVFLKPPHLNFEQAAFLEPLACVVHGMRGMDRKKDETALVVGAGPIGLLYLLLLTSRGFRVIITDLDEGRLAVARRMGADQAVPPAQVSSAVFAMTGTLGVDLVFECTGQPEVWETAVTFVRRGGTIVLFGGCKKGTTVTYDTHRLHYDELTLRGVFHYTPDDVREAYDALCAGLDVSVLISGRYPLDHIEIAFDRLSRGDGVKYAIIP